MKNDKKVLLPVINEKKPIPEKVPVKGKDKKSKPEVIDETIPTSVVDRTRPRSGGGLANEGTIVSYDEER